MAFYHIPMEVRGLSRDTEFNSGRFNNGDNIIIVIKLIIAILAHVNF